VISTSVILSQYTHVTDRQADRRQTDYRRHNSRTLQCILQRSAENVYFKTKSRLRVPPVDVDVVRWSETPVEQRSALLLRVADLLEANLDEFAEAESRDQGKPVWLARSLDIPRAIYNFRCFATAVPHHSDRCVTRYSLPRSSNSLFPHNHDDGDLIEL